MGWEKEYEGFLTMLDAVDSELLAADGVGSEEIEAFLSEDGEARRRFLKAGSSLDCGRRHRGCEPAFKLSD